MNVFDNYVFSKKNKKFIEFIKKQKKPNVSFLELVQKWKQKNSFYYSDFYTLLANCPLSPTEQKKIEGLIEDFEDDDILDVTENYWVGTDFEKSIGLSKKIEQEEEYSYLTQYHKSKKQIIKILKQYKEFKEWINETKYSKLFFGQNFLARNKDKLKNKDCEIIETELDKMNFCLTRIVEKYLPMVQRRAWEFYKWKYSSGLINNFTREDATSAGIDGILSAIELWDESRSKTLSTMVYVWIFTKIKTDFEKYNSDLHINVSDLNILSSKLKEINEQKQAMDFEDETLGDGSLLLETKRGVIKFNYFNTFKTTNVDEKTMKIAENSNSYINDAHYIDCRHNLLTTQNNLKPPLTLEKKLELGLYPYIIHTKKEIEYIITDPLASKTKKRNKK